MASVVFSTPGLIPIEAFTTFGLHAKPNSDNPLGFFGTGLKYAIAVCLRMGQEVVIWRGKDKYTFYLKRGDFRGKEVERVRMKLETFTVIDVICRKATYHDLPFTTDLGKTWELWQAFREFETNTRDEGGKTFIFEEQYFRMTSPELTCIVVTGQKFVDEFHDMGRNFLKDGASQRTSSDRIQVLDRPSKHIYYRGMRIMDLKEEARYTYNFLMHVDLTEDRTAKYPSLLEGEIADAIKSSQDPAFIDQTVPHRTYGGRAYYEHSIPYRHSYVAASPAFMDAARVAKQPELREYWDQMQPTVATSCNYRIRIPKAGLSDEEKVALIEHICILYPDALLVDEHLTTWGDTGEIADDDVPF